MQVNLQVVGLFYNVELNMPDTGQTVKDLMDAATATPDPTGSMNGAAKFNYSTHIDSPGAAPTMLGITAMYDGPFKSRVLEKHYPAGTYSLTETFDPASGSKSYSVWQYYIFDANDQYKNPTNSAISFTEQSLDGITRVVWRLVTILGEPTLAIGEEEYLMKRNPKLRALGV